ncbi:hypothetical protein MTP99_002946 [Tenebrio molitor]|jgi:hypothetical protein|uniref:Uncharacterized protein n=1 Tax=Tenebrio molitor TaxID=7067 RepID=A0A8J6LCZ9_TENMO|nr:hypothetical protein GEV33_007488 [Tenebrio molitor]KAJ3622437.1 hypothetical protein MTP99_002946 [Tenebrio molitor]
MAGKSSRCQLASAPVVKQSYKNHKSNKYAIKRHEESAESYYEETPSGKTPEEATQCVVTCLGLNEDKKKVLSEQLNSLDIDPVLVLKVRNTWIPPPNENADAVLDAIATWQSPKLRRDHWLGARRWLFHFRDICEITACRLEMFNTRPYCFGVSPDLVNNGIAVPQGNIFADAVAVNKTAVKEDDIFVYPFFM